MSEVDKNARAKSPPILESLNGSVYGQALKISLQDIINKGNGDLIAGLNKIFIEFPGVGEIKISTKGVESPINLSYQKNEKAKQLVLEIKNQKSAHSISIIKNPNSDSGYAIRTNDMKISTGCILKLVDENSSVNCGLGLQLNFQEPRDIFSPSKLEALNLDINSNKAITLSYTVERLGNILKLRGGFLPEKGLFGDLFTTFRF
jgi:hypothetical protein